MKVFNPGTTPVVVDNGAVVPAGEHADITAGPKARTAIERRQLVEKTPKPAPRADAPPPAPSSEAPVPPSGGRQRGASR